MVELVARYDVVDLKVPLVFFF